MHSLIEIPGIEETSLELLEAAGFRDCESLARAGVAPLTDEIGRANRILQITEHPPSPEQIAGWIRAARGIIGGESDEPDSETVMPVNFETLPHVVAMLDNAPCAIPFPGRWLSESNIKVSEIIPGILLNRCDGDLQIRIEDRIPQSQGLPKPSSNQYVQIAERPQQTRLEIDLTKLRPLDEVSAMPRGRRRSSPAHGSLPSKSSGVDAMDLLETRDPIHPPGVERRPRGQIRGVLHSDPWAIRFGALLTLLLLVTILLAVISGPLLLLSDRHPEAFSWVRPWWIIFPFFVPVMALFWLIWGYSCSCRICRQKLFVPKKHRKNAKAHHVPLVGYILPLILHLLLFQWFRCTHCGTPVRLKK